MHAADQPQVVEPGWPAISPEDQVMPVTPGRWPVAPGEDAMLIPRHQRAARGRRNAASGMRDFLLQLAKPSDTRDRRVARQPANGCRGDGAAPLQLTRRSSVDARQRVEVGLDDQLRTR